MLKKTRGIILRNTSFRDTSVITKIFTLDLGVKSYIINGVKKPKAAISMAALQPLNLVNLEVYDKNTASVQRIKELKCAPLLLDIHQDLKKRSIAIFLIEILNECLNDDFADALFFDFCERTILELNEQMYNPNFPINFLVKLSDIMGVLPEPSYLPHTPYLDAENGIFVASSTISQHQQLTFQAINELIVKRDNSENVVLHHSLRKEVFHTLLHYFQVQILKNKKIKSIDILGEIFN